MCTCRRLQLRGSVFSPEKITWDIQFDMVCGFAQRLRKTVWQQWTRGAELISDASVWTTVADIIMTDCSSMVSQCDD